MAEETKKTGAAEEIYLTPDPNPEDTASPATGETTSSAPAKPKKKVVAVGELPEFREGNRKVFRMSDGSEQAVFYPETVHVFNEDTQQYEEVNNALTEEPDGRHFRNGTNHFTARFSKEETNDELFSVEKGAHRITVSVKKNKKQQNRGVIPALRKRARTDTQLETMKDVLVFGDVLSDTDMEYAVSGNGVKEDIIVKKKKATYRYPFVLDCENVTPTYVETENRVLFSDPETGDEVFCIPAPFMTDANGVTSNGVFYEVKPLSEGKLSLTVIADSGWINAEDRAFPVTIDPQIMVSGTMRLDTYSWNCGNIFSSVHHNVGIIGNGDGTCNANRMYMQFLTPILPRNPRIKKAELKFTQVTAASQCEDCPKIGLYQVLDTISTGACTPMHSATLLDYDRVKLGQFELAEDGVTYVPIEYTFDVTYMVDKLIRGETASPKFVLKMLDEETNCETHVSLYGSMDSEHAPTLSITYEPSYGVNSSYRAHTHELGRFGQGSIDLQCGNLMLDFTDFAWGGNRMPVTLRHVYNSALSDYQYTVNSGIGLHTADFGAMYLGHGWKLNIMQSMVPRTFRHEGAVYEGYVYVDENGNQTLFKQSKKTCCCTDNSQCYNLYEDVNDGGMLYDPCLRELKNGGEILLFDGTGRLIRVSDEYGNHMDITYTNGLITSVTDGAGREFGFSYNLDHLFCITAPDGSSILYSYDTANDIPNNIAFYPSGDMMEITGTAGKITAVTLRDRNSTPLYKVAYEYTGDRVSKVSEFGMEDGAFVAGVSSAYTYSAAAGRTVVQTTEPADTDEGETKDTVVKTVYTFDDDGNVVSEYMYTDDTGNVGVDGEESGIHPHSADGGAGMVSISSNLLRNHGFNGTTDWPGLISNTGGFEIGNRNSEFFAKFGGSVLSMTSQYAANTGNGVYQDTMTLPAGEYTFSAYVSLYADLTGDDNRPGVYLRVTTTDGATVLAESERIAEYSSEYIRLAAPFVLDKAMSVRVNILMDGQGTAFADAAQLERNPFVNAYNLLSNGTFENGLTDWEGPENATAVTSDKFNMTRSVKMTGDLDKPCYIGQTIDAKTIRSTRETFTLSGWAKGSGLVDRERNCCAPAPKFRLRAIIQYADPAYGEYSSEEYTADFSPCTEEWQFASVQFAKEKYRQIQGIHVYCDYSNNTGTAYFDDIQLVRNSLETGLAPDDFTVEITDDTYVEDEQEVTEDTVADTAPEFKEMLDAYGNALTQTTFTDGEFGTIYRSFGFTSDCNGAENAGNDLIRETDARGGEIHYAVNEDTSRNEEVTDRCGNKTAYEYDSVGRTTKVTAKNADGTELATVAYAYDPFNDLTEITRGDGMKYALAYNAFHNLESIGVSGMASPLVKYTYKNGNGRLKAVTYANGHVMKATYNGAGQLVAEKWFASATATTPMAHYKYVYDGQGNIVRSIDITCKREYTYTYEDGRIVRAAESLIILNGEIITDKILLSSILYSYDSEGNLTKKGIRLGIAPEQTVYYENPEDGNEVVKFVAGGQTVTSHSKTDSFGRKSFDELQLGTGFVSRQFSYHAGEETEEHKTGGRLKSSPTTQLVSQITLSDGRTLSYEYDAEERITKVTDSVDGVTEYTYDALGQLLTETHDGVLVNQMTYDSYGNILLKNGIQYAYDSVWKDRLCCYNGQNIVYDAQGNPTDYLGHALTWEKGRQLKSFDNITYSYNANGIRTSKKVGNTYHTYTLDGTKILREVRGNNILLPLYDNEDSVCGIVYDDEPYYFFKNLQGDIIGITDKDGNTVARYTYDAWGVCTVTQDTSGCGIATVNPFRYRGYYLDTETGLYYLQSRYYDAGLGRFINGDDTKAIDCTTNIISNNIFVYCENTTPNAKDSTGLWIWNLVCGVIGAALFGAIAYFITDLFGLKGDLQKGVIAVFALVGGALGALFGPKILVNAFNTIKPWLKEMRRKTKIIKFNPKNPENLGGVVLLGYIKVMMHLPHLKNPYNPHKYLHLQIEFGSAKFRIRLGKNVK